MALLRRRGAGPAESTELPGSTHPCPRGLPSHKLDAGCGVRGPRGQAEWGREGEGQPSGPLYLAPISVSTNEKLDLSLLKTGWGKCRGEVKVGEGGPRRAEGPRSRLGLAHWANDVSSEFGQPGVDLA